MWQVFLSLWPADRLRSATLYYIYVSGGRDSSVVIITRYGLDGLGIVPAAARYSEPVQAGPGVQPAFCTIGTWLVPGGKATGAWR
jgi:hypothetical protein